MTIKLIHFWMSWKVWKVVRVEFTFHLSCRSHWEYIMHIETHSNCQFWKSSDFLKQKASWSGPITATDFIFTDMQGSFRVAFSYLPFCTLYRWNYMLTYHSTGIEIPFGYRHQSETALILHYYLIQKNKEFFIYVLSRTDPETMVSWIGWFRDLILYGRCLVNFKSRLHLSLLYGWNSKLQTLDPSPGQVIIPIRHWGKEL